MPVSKYVEFPLEDGGSIVIESADEAMRTSTGFLRSDEGAMAPNAARGSFDASMEAVRRSADLLVSRLHGLSVPPDEMEVKFGLKASVELGTLAVSKGGADANFTVTLKWGGRPDGDSKSKDDGQPKSAE
jgi:hypothetical protein